jgi:L-ascorbate metabolism protein UlaG (beta-lactamase superfamily)
MIVEHDGLDFERLGHASVRIATDDRVLYIDPWSEALDDAPHDADMVFLTHDDFDHYDVEGIAAVAGSETTIIAYEAIDTSDLDREVTSLAHDGALTVNGIDVRAVPAYNRSDGEHVDDEGEPFHAEGEVIGLLLGIDGTTVYFPSDTDFLEEHTDIAADVFVPPIGGHFTMDRREAARFTESVEPGLVLPVHYDTFEQVETDAEAFAEDVETDGRRVELM